MREGDIRAIFEKERSMLIWFVFSFSFLLLEKRLEAEKKAEKNRNSSKVSVKLNKHSTIDRKAVSGYKMDKKLGAGGFGEVFRASRGIFH
jgi:hypothetical protein